MSGFADALPVAIAIAAAKKKSDESVVNDLPVTNALPVAAALPVAIAIAAKKVLDEHLRNEKTNKDNLQSDTSNQEYYVFEFTRDPSTGKNTIINTGSMKDDKIDFLKSDDV